MPLFRDSKSLDEWGLSLTRYPHPSFDPASSATVPNWGGPLDQPGPKLPGRSISRSQGVRYGGSGKLLATSEHGHDPGSCGSLDHKGGDLVRQKGVCLNVEPDGVDGMAPRPLSDPSMPRPCRYSSTRPCEVRGDLITPGNRTRTSKGAKGLSTDTDGTPSWNIIISVI